MAWDAAEAIRYYKSQGAPGDQIALTGLLKEAQAEFGAVPCWLLGEIAGAYNVKESFLQAIIRRIPSLCLEDTHLLELCAGPNCARAAKLAQFAERLPRNVTLRYTGCMRQCAKGPNLKWDGKLCHGADEALLKKLAEQS